MKLFFALLIPLVLFGCGSEPSPDAANVSSKSEEAVAYPVTTAEPDAPNASSPSENQSASLHPPKDLLDTAVAMESLTMKQEPPSANPDDNQTFYTSDGKRFSGWVKKYWESNKSQVQMLSEFKNGLISGKSWTWHENGQLESIEHHKNDVAHGSHIMWYANGQKAHEVTYKDGKLDGLVSVWYDNGLKHEETTFKDGQPNGLHVEWHKNGKKRMEATLKNGKLIGTATKWTKDGKLVSE